MATLKGDKRFCVVLYDPDMGFDERREFDTPMAALANASREVSERHGDCAVGVYDRSSEKWMRGFRHRGCPFPYKDTAIDEVMTLDEDASVWESFCGETTEEKLTAADAKSIASRNPNDEARRFRDRLRKDIRKAAERGERSAFLAYADCCDADQYAAVQELKEDGFGIYRHRETNNGYLQDEGFYARW